MKSINDADQDSQDCWHAREAAGNCQALLLRRGWKGTVPSLRRKEATAFTAGGERIEEHSCHP